MGCGASTNAAATRVLDADSALLSTTPVCFVPPNPAFSLTERAQQANIQEICEAAARKQGVSVVPFNGKCLSVTTLWTVRDTGDREGECSKTWVGAECQSSAVQAKSLKLTLAEPANGRPLAETTATIRSTHAQFSRESFQALCSAAFHDFPQPLSNAQFQVPID